MKKIEAIIEEKVRPILRNHNGDITLLEVTSEGLVKVKLMGACGGCPGAQQTLSEVVEAALKEECPEIKGLVLVQQVSDELVDVALKILRKDRKKHGN